MKKLSLSWKLTLAFMLVGFVTAALLAVAIRVTSADRLNQLIIEQQRGALQQTLVDFYTANGGWDGVNGQWSQLQAGFITPGNGPAGGHGPGNGRPQNPRNRQDYFGLADAQGSVIVPVDQHLVGAYLPAGDLQAGTPVQVDSKQVGTILTSSQVPGLNPEETLFLERTSQALIFAIIGAMLLALVLGLVLARTLTLPLRALTRAAQGVGRGELVQQVKVGSQDELGQLAAAFNRMSLEVARVNQQRRQMTADIAHDLRTPLTVIGGYVESMRDGVLAPTPERLALIYAEIERLQRLVGDLRMLTQVDAGELSLHPQPIPAQALLERAAALFEHNASQQGVALVVDLGDESATIQVDEARMMQVLDNLLSNALRYTPQGGKITLLERQEQGKVRLVVKDTGSGISPEELPHIFDRFYRADSSRHSESGETGLGLAIVRALVEAHGGRVWAESTPGQGTSITIELPAVK